MLFGQEVEAAWRARCVQELGAEGRTWGPQQTGSRAVPWKGRKQRGGDPPPRVQPGHPPSALSPL